MTALSDAVDNPKFRPAIDRVEALFLEGTPLSVAFSGGKDSSVLLDIVLIAAVSAKEKGAEPFILVTNGDTGVENPEISQYLKTESQKIKAYASSKGLNLEYHIAKPLLNDTWAVQVIGGRKLPSFPKNNSDCSVDYKVRPMTSLRKRLLKDLKMEDGEAVTLVGTRFSESAQRAKNMADREETHMEPTRNKDGDLIYPAIADFETDEVWEWIGMSRSGFIESYSDFDDLMRIYADAGNTSCAVVSDALTEGVKAARGGCGARTGCMICTKVKDDKSLNSMILSDKSRYGYMEAPGKLREFIVNTQWDFSRRNWVGKTINDGKITIRPDTYSPQMCLDLLRYALTIDAKEFALASQRNSEPRFELVPIEALIAIDATWSLQGIHKPFQAIKEYIDIFEYGKRFEVPNIEEVKRSPMPSAEYVELDTTNNDYLGLRSPLLEMHGESNCMSTRQMANGKLLLDVETSSSFDIDYEGACLAMEFESDRMMDIHQKSDGKSDLTRGYRWWVQMGAISLSPQQLNMHDEILRRTALKETIGAAGPDVNVDDLLDNYGVRESVFTP